MVGFRAKTLKTIVAGLIIFVLLYKYQNHATSLQQAAQLSAQQLSTSAQQSPQQSAQQSAQQLNASLSQSPQQRTQQLSASLQQSSQQNAQQRRMSLRQAAQQSAQPLRPVVNANPSSSLYNQSCPNPPPGLVVTADNVRAPWTQFPSITAIIYFIYDHYDVIPYLELMYASLFPRVVYCGPTPLLSSPRPWLARYNITFVTYNKEDMSPGYLFYMCMSKVMQQDMAAAAAAATAGHGKEHGSVSVEGYLIFPDDMFVFPQRIPFLNRDEIWYWPHNKLIRLDLASKKECDGGSILSAATPAAANKVKCQRPPTFPYKWYNFKSFDNFWSDLQSSPEPHEQIFRKRLSAFMGSDRRMLAAWADTFYAPVSLNSDFIRMADVCRRNKIGLDMAVANILVAISSDPGNWEEFTGFVDWDKPGRDQPWKFYDDIYMFPIINVNYHHPTKWGFMLKGNKQMQSFFCNKVLPILHSSHGRM